MTPAWLRSAELARSSQEHLQRTVKYGGRRRLPSLSEMRAFLVLGRRRLGLPVAGGGAVAPGHQGPDPGPALAERTRNPPASNSPAWGCGL